jgi:Flp pilus assembly protein TadG
MKKGGRIRSVTGASAVEFALVLPVLLLILFGIIEYGWVLTYQIVLTNAVFQGARAGVKAVDDVDAQEYAKQAVREAFWIRNLKEDAVETSILDDENPKRIEVRVPGIDYKPLTGFLPSTLIPDKVAAKAVMVFP